jgi:ribosomal protein L40E
MNFCSNCGARLVPGDDFCRNCGTKVQLALNPKKARNWIGLLVLGLVLGFTCAVCFMGMSGFNAFFNSRVGSGSNASQGTGSGETASSGASQPVFQTPLPQLTWTPAGTPTPAPTPTPPPPPVSIDGQHVLFQDDFSDPEAAWTKSNVNQQASYLNGELVLRDIGGSYGGAWAHPQLSFENFILEFDARWSGDSVGGRYGVSYRYVDSDNHYNFSVSNDGRYLAGKVQNGNYTVLLEGFSGAIGSGGSPNRVHIEANGPQIRFFINGEYLGEILDNGYPAGDILLWSSTSDQQADFQATFDNVLVALHP